MKKAIEEVQGTKERVEFYLALSGKYVYLKDTVAVSVVFSEFSDDAKPFTYEEAKKLAERYNLDIIQITVKTTIEIDRKVVMGQVEK